MTSPSNLPADQQAAITEAVAAHRSEVLDEITRAVESALSEYVKDRRPRHPASRQGAGRVRRAGRADSGEPTVRPDLTRLHRSVGELQGGARELGPLTVCWLAFVIGGLLGLLAAVIVVAHRARKELEEE